MIWMILVFVWFDIVLGIIERYCWYILLGNVSVFFEVFFKWFLVFLNNNVIIGLYFNKCLVKCINYC